MYQYARVAGTQEKNYLLGVKDQFLEYAERLQIVDDTFTLIRLGNALEVLNFDDIKSFFPYLEILANMKPSTIRPTITTTLAQYTRPQKPQQTSNPYVSVSPSFANPYHREYQFRSDFRSQLERLVEFPSYLALVMPYLTKKQRDLLRSRVKRTHLLNIERGYDQYLDVIRSFGGSNADSSNLACWNLGLLPYSDFSIECPVDGWFPCDDDSLTLALHEHYSSIGPGLLSCVENQRTKWKMKSKVKISTALAEHYEGNPAHAKRLEYLKSIWRSQSWHPVQGILYGGSARGSKILFGDNEEYEKDDNGDVKYFAILDRSFEFFNFQEAMEIVEEIGKFFDENQSEINDFCCLKLPSTVKFWVLSECFSSLDKRRREEIQGLLKNKNLNKFLCLKRRIQQDKVQEYVFELMDDGDGKGLSKLMASLQRDSSWKIKLPDFVYLEVLKRIREDDQFFHLRGRKWEKHLYEKLHKKYDDLQIPTKLILERELKKSSMEQSKFIQTKISNLPKRPSSPEEISLNVNYLIGLLNFSLNSSSRMNGIFKALKNVPIYWIYFIRACVFSENRQLLKDALDKCLRTDSMSQGNSIRKKPY